MNLFYKFKIDPVNVTVLISIILTSWQLAISNFSFQFQFLFFIAGISFIGIPHGALDHLVSKQTAERKQKTFSFLLFLVKYSLLIGVYSFAWFFFPQLSLITFILISSWHFGETDLINDKQFVGVAIQLMYGLSIVLWLVLGHHTEANLILASFININSITLKVWLFLTLHEILYLSLSATIILITLITMLFKSAYKKRQVIQLFIILLCSYIIPLLPAFVIYFVGWHSVITFQNLHRYLEGKKLNRNSIFKLWIKALPFTILAIILLFLTKMLINRYLPSYNLVPLVFIFISLITLPHIEVMHGLNKSKNTN